MEIIATEAFIKSAKPLAKKYRSFQTDYDKLVEELSANPWMGVDLGGGYRKVRMTIGSKGKGKSGGARVITLDAIERNGRLYLLYVYDKADYDNVILSVVKDLASESGL